MAAVIFVTAAHMSILYMVDAFDTIASYALTVIPMRMMHRNSTIDTSETRDTQRP